MTYNITKKRNRKRILIIGAIIIIAVSLWYTNRLVSKMAQDERRNVEIWAKSIHQKASLVKNTELFFEKLRNEEKRKVKLLAEATKRSIMENNANSNSYSFYLQIISNNKTIPVVLTDYQLKIINAINVDFNKDTVDIIANDLLKDFTKYPPIKFNYITGEVGENIRDSKTVNYFFYKDSKIYTEIKTYLDGLTHSFFSDVVINSASVPVIITDSTQSKIISSGNFLSTDVSNKKKMENALNRMKDEGQPIEIEFSEFGKSYIFYENSYLLRQFKFYPYIQIGVIILFVLFSYLVFSSFRRSEQNQVWAGMAKETAHQLGTPLSSLMAWIEMLKLQNVDKSIITEMQKDITRLDEVTQRFSKIGSKVQLKQEDLQKIVLNAIEYLKTRLSKKITYQMVFPEQKETPVLINTHLFNWVIENLCKNAVDAMEGEGELTICISEEGENVFLDISDTGKGMDRRMISQIFAPGFTTKERGWGLGLTLAQRIIKMYHHGKIFVKESTPGIGTTFRIQLKKGK